MTQQILQDLKQEYEIRLASANNYEYKHLEQCIEKIDNEIINLDPSYQTGPRLARNPSKPKLFYFWELVY